MHNPNLMYAIYPITSSMQEVMETFFVNTLWKDHLVNQGDKAHAISLTTNCVFVSATHSWLTKAATPAGRSTHDTIRK